MAVCTAANSYQTLPLFIYTVTIIFKFAANKFSTNILVVLIVLIIVHD